MTTIFEFIRETYTIFSFFINSLLIFLILAKSPKLLGSYKWLMIFMSFSVFGFALVDFLIKPEVISIGSSWIVGTNSKRCILPISWTYSFVLLWGASYGITVASFGVHFIFRYLLVTRNGDMVSGPFKLLAWLCIPVISGSVYASMIHIFFTYDNFIQATVRSQVQEIKDLSENDIVYYGFHIYNTNTESGNREFNWPSLMGMGVTGGIVTLSLIIMIYFAIKTYAEIQTLTSINDNTSSVSHALQRQLFYSLVVQTSIPIILVHFPTTILVTFAFMGDGIQFYGDLITMTISLFPAIDPLPSLFIIKAYRDAMLCRASNQAFLSAQN